MGHALNDECKGSVPSRADVEAERNDVGSDVSILSKLPQILELSSQVGIRIPVATRRCHVGKNDNFIASFLIALSTLC